MKKYDEIMQELMEQLKDDDDLFCELVDELDSWNGFADGFRCYYMEELDELHCGLSLSEFMDRLTSGFYVRDDYFYYSIYGLESTDDKAGLYRENVDEGELLDNVRDNLNNIYISDSSFAELLEELEEIENAHA